MEWSVLDWNAPAIRFYRRIGARLDKEWMLTRLTGPALRRLGRGGALTENGCCVIYAPPWSSVIGARCGGGDGRACGF